MRTDGRSSRLSTTKSITKKQPLFRGKDSDGRSYRNQTAMWSDQLKEEDQVEHRSELSWYKKAKEYWSKVEPTVDGMLGGRGDLSDLDVETSKNFLQTLDGVDFNGVALGIGRVSKHLLLPLFDRVDLLESNPNYLEQSKTYVNEDRLDRRICSGMEDFAPEKDRYSVIWVQWCILYLTDADLIRFFSSCVEAVRTDGYVCIKDNICKTGFVLDNDDSGITRSERYLVSLLEQANIQVVRSELQGDFPDDLFPVKMFALRKNPSPPQEAASSS